MKAVFILLFFLFTLLSLASAETTFFEGDHEEFLLVNPSVSPEEQVQSTESTSIQQNTTPSEGLGMKTTVETLLSQGIDQTRVCSLILTAINEQGTYGNTSLTQASKDKILQELENQGQTLSKEDLDFILLHYNTICYKATFNIFSQLAQGRFPALAYFTIFLKITGKVIQSSFS